LLLEKAGEVLAIEMDARLVEFLRERFGTRGFQSPASRAFRLPQPSRVKAPCFTLLHDDALEFLKREPRDWSDWKLVANLPYSVASPILVELAQSPARQENAWSRRCNSKSRSG
jgi:16S rRNA A1518/A1519 N6-dimethyltransferase RsmA/KsgA/DIM1 with predicted DNA glycosylase/AP lyase activity